MVEVGNTVERRTMSRGEEDSTVERRKNLLGEGHLRGEEDHPVAKMRIPWWKWDIPWGGRQSRGEEDDHVGRRSIWVGEEDNLVVRRTIF